MQSQGAGNSRKEPRILNRRTSTELSTRPRIATWKALILGTLFLGWIAGVVLPLVGGQSPVDLGLDLAGGVRVTYRPDFDALGEEWADADRATVLAQAKETLASRLSRGSTVVPDVVVRSDDRILVSLPGTEDRTEALERIGRTYRLTFRRVLEPPAIGETGARFDSGTHFEYRGQRLALGPVRFAGDMLAERSIAAQSAPDGLLSSPIVSFRFAPPHDDAFARFTGEHLGERLAILLDDEVFWVGRIESEIRGEGSLRGAASLDEAEELARMLRSGSLPVPLEVEGLTVVGSVLGHEVASQGLRALGLSLAVLVALLVVAYLGRRDLLLAGLLSTLSLAVLISGLTAAFDLTLDLAGIAGLVLSIGMGMDAFFLVFERLASRPREPQAGGLSTSFSTGLTALYSFSGEGRTLFHANATTLLVVTLLLGSERLASFALFLIVGLLASVLNIFVTRRILAALGRSTRRTPLEGTGLFHRFRSARPGLYQARLVYGLAVLALLVLGLGPGLVGDGPVGPGLGPELRAGTELVVQGPEEGLLAALDDLRLAGSRTVRHRTLGDPGEQRWLLTFDAPHTGSGNGAETLLDHGLHLDRTLREHGLRLEGLGTIDPQLSATRLAESLRVLGVSFLLLAFYFVAIEGPIDRFFRPGRALALSPSSRLRVFGGLLLAVIVDLGVVLAALTLLGQPVGLPAVAALLAIVGYSVNDSVVLWSHVQQGWERCRKLPRKERPSPREVVTRAVDEITSRAVLTTVSTAIPAGAILVTGPEALRSFAWVILLGTLSGTLSSLFVVGSTATAALGREDARTGARGSHEDRRTEPAATPRIAGP